MEVDHITPLWADPEQDPYAQDGLQVLCRGCHLEKTREENRRQVRLKKLDPPDVEAWRSLVRDLYPDY